MAFLRICHLVCSCHCGRARKGDVHLVTTKDRVGVTSHLTPLSCKPLDRWMGTGFTFSFLKKISVTTGNGIPAEISRFFGNFDRKEFSNSKFRNFGIPAGFSVHLAGFSVLFTEKWWKQLENDGEIMYLWKEIENFGEFALIMSIFIDYNTQHIRNSSTQWEIRKRNT